MTKPRVRWTLAAVALASAPAFAATPAQNCQSANKEAAKYDGCRLKAEAKYATSLDGGSVVNGTSRTALFKFTK